MLFINDVYLKISSGSPKRTAWKQQIIFQEKRRLYHTSTNGPLFHLTGNVRSVGGRMAKIANYTALLFAIAMFAIVANQSSSAVAFAEGKDGRYDDTPSTALTDPKVVCGDHKCAQGESPQDPTPVTPVRGH